MTQNSYNSLEFVIKITKVIGFKNVFPFLQSGIVDGCLTWLRSRVFFSHKLPKILSGFKKKWRGTKKTQGTIDIWALEASRSHRIIISSYSSLSCWATKQISNPWCMPNSVSKSFGPAMRMGLLRQFQWRPTIHMWVSSSLCCGISLIQVHHIPNPK